MAILVTDDFKLDTPLAVRPAAVRAAWIDALRSGRFTLGRGVLRWGDERCVFGLLCEVCESMGLISLMPYEWDRELPPYSVCLLAGVEFDYVEVGEASGRDVDEICGYADTHFRTRTEIARMITDLFEDRRDRAPRPVRVEFYATNGLGGNGCGEYRIGGDLYEQSERA
jgi:hypothetical protein